MEENSRTVVATRLQSRYLAPHLAELLQNDGHHLLLRCLLRSLLLRTVRCSGAAIDRPSQELHKLHPVWSDGSFNPLIARHKNLQNPSALNPD